MFKNKRILITGSNGFIGRNLVLELKNFDVEIGVIKTKEPAFTTNGHRVYVGNIEDAAFVKKTVEDFNPHIVYHLAANKSRLQQNNILQAALNTNLIGSLNIYESLLHLKDLVSVVALGTIDEYGGSNTPYQEMDKELPLSAYGFSKLMSTKLAEFFYRTQHLPITVLRPTIAYGPFQGNDMFIPSLINSLLNSKDYLMTPGEQNRDFIYITDLISLMFKVADCKECIGKTYNAGSGISIKLNEVARAIAKILNKETCLKIGAINYREGEQMGYAISNDFIRSSLDWHPKVSLQEGLLKTIEYYRLNQNE